MDNQVYSWSKPTIENLVGRKKVDYSIFEYGTTIPKEFHNAFSEESAIKKGESKSITLDLNGEQYEASLVNIDRGSSRGLLQIRYDKNNHLKEILKMSFSATYNYLQENRKTGTKKPTVLPNEESEYMDFYKTNVPDRFKVELVKKNSLSRQSFWWVNQGKTHNQQKQGGYLWAPQLSKQGIPLAHHVDLQKAKIGDIVFCYSALEVKAIAVVEAQAIESDKPSEIDDHDWQKEGFLLKVKYLSVDPFIHKDQIPLDWRIDESGPFNKKGDLKQGYFYQLTESFVSKLADRFEDRFPIHLNPKHLYEKPKSGFSKVQLDYPSYVSERKLIDHIHKYIQSKGFQYTKDEITNYFLSLRTKPFVILFGISGTGKTKITELFAESVDATEENGQFTLIPVRPDWNDGSDLLGYIDIQGDFQEGPLTTVIKKAQKDSANPYFAVLDEMNLARVEHYFSDVLSVMETRKWQEDEIVTSRLLTKDTFGVNMTLPANLFIVGTVNMDETTHPFSKKVLDRANTIEFNNIDLENLAFLEKEDQVEPLIIGYKQLSSSYLHLKDVYTNHKDTIHSVIEELKEINKILEPIFAQVGYRVRDEISFYIVYNQQSELLSFESAFDYCILQKVLPRITGSDSRTDHALKELYKQFTQKEYSDMTINKEADLETATYPKSAKKVLEMLRRLEEDGFTSFWIS